MATRSSKAGTRVETTAERDAGTSPIITFTTDFGHKGPFVAVMKGVILARHPAARIIDLTHEIPAHWPPEAGFWLERAYRYFPHGAVHVAVVDPGVGTERGILAAEVDGHRFLAPDNGLLGSLLERAERVVSLDYARLPDFGIHTPSATFHGRDIFAPIAAEIAAGRLGIAALGPTVTDWAPGWLDEPARGGERVEGVVVTIDNFGNLITNIDATAIEGWAAPVALAGGRRFPFADTYGRVSPGDYLALVNSFGVVEIARAEGSAAEGLGLGRGAPVTVSATRG